MIGICIGHSRKGDKGAYTLSPDSVSEYDFNKALVPLTSPDMSYTNSGPAISSNYVAWHFTDTSGFTGRPAKVGND